MTQPNPHDKGQHERPAGPPDDHFDVNAIHLRIVSREKTEPEEGKEPPPWWLWTFIVVLLFAMGVYIGRYGGSFSEAVHEVEEGTQNGSAGAAEPVSGAAVFSAICQPCHQSHGMGIRGQYPPLAGSEWLLRDAETPARIVLSGLTGSITAAGVTVSNTMPPLGERLTDEEIAAALTYARAAWQNASPPITAPEVAAVRKVTGRRGPWTPSELLSLRGRGGKQ